jgi:hypothetical protein
MYIFNNHIRRILQVILLFTMIWSLPSCRYIRQKLNLGEYSLKSAIEWAKADSARIADSLKSVRVEKTDIKRALPDSMKKVISAKEVFERTLTDTLMSIDDKNPTQGNSVPRFYIITGSFSNHDNAVLAANKYSNQGYITALIKVSGNNGARLELVSVKTFMDHSEASAFLREFKAKYYPDAWIYTGK